MPNAPLAAGNRLLSLPDYRPQILLAPSAKLTFSGETSSEVLVGSQPGMTQLKLDHGRLTIVSVADAGAQIELQLPERTGTVVLSDADSMLAVEILPVWPNGEIR